MLVWCESLPVYLVYMYHSKCGPVTFLASLGGLPLQHPSYQEENPRSGIAEGAEMELQLFLKLKSLVVCVGKWLPFSQIGGIPTSAREPLWWHINGVPNNMTRKWLPQTKLFILFLARASVPITNDHIQSFNSQPLILCPWLPN